MPKPAQFQAHALIIGVAEYRHARPLPATILNDANEIVATLASPHYCGYAPGNIITLLDEQATRSAVLQALSDLAARTAPGDTACVYFSGHGAISKGASDSALLTVDSDPLRLDMTSISAAEFSDALRAIQATRLLVFLDACHSGGAGTPKGTQLEDEDEFEYGYVEKSIESLAVGAGRVLIASSRANERSYIMPGERNSAFTKPLLEGLRGAADSSGDGFIKVFDLFEYLSESVPRATGDIQHPVFKGLDMEKNFPIALSRGGEKSIGSAARTWSSVPRKTAASSDPWAALETALVELYPMGPQHKEIWSRAGGDLSRLEMVATGRASWHAAIKSLKQGGGGVNISFESLLDEALEDFSANPALIAIAAR